MTIKERLIKGHICILDSGCWEWVKFCDDRGYARINFGGKNCKAHRLSFEAFEREIPCGKCVLHKCDNPKCINPKHLFLGTQIENIQDMVAKGRQRKNGGHQSAKLTDAQIFEIRELFSRGAKNKDIVQQYGITKGHASNIKAGRVWRHL